MALDAVRAAVVANPATVGLFFDLDGTLAPIQDDPESVAPLPGVVESIETLTGHVGVVAIVSGRPISFLETFFTDDRVQLSGLYGLEQRVDGNAGVDAEAKQWLPAIASTVARASQEFGSDSVEDKTYSLTVHYRGQPAEVADRVRRWATGIAIETGLDARDAKQSVEIHPPGLGGKGDAVDRMLGSVRTAAYFGDDVGDQSAFELLAVRAGDGSLTDAASVLVASAEAPDSIRAVATDIVDGPEYVRDLLLELAAALSQD